MKNYRVRDEAVVLILTKNEASQLLKKLQRTGFHPKKTKPLLKAEEKLLLALGEL